MRVQTTPESRGVRLDIFLSKTLGGLTRSQLQALNRRGGIRVDGRRRKAGYRLQGAETIEIDPPQREASTLEPEEIPIAVHYEDDVLAVIEKPAGIVVHPGAGNRRGTLAHALVARFPELSELGGPGRPGIVHRLDKWTSGLIVVAKDNRAHHRLSMGFQRRQVRKTYLALVHGRLDPKSGSIDLAIRRHPKARTRMMTDHSRGRPARSHYQVIEESETFSLLEVRIYTGRTHQIRIHLSSIGHPVVGDSTYGEKHHAQFLRRYGGLDRYFLHAAKLEFAHPLTDQTMSFASSLPQELVQLWKVLKATT